MCSFFFKKVEPAVVVVCGDIVQEEERHLLNGWRSLEETVYGFTFIPPRRKTHIISYERA